MELKERMRAALNQEGKKLTQAGMARACKLSPPSVNDWFSGKSKTLEGENLINAANYLGVNAAWLASGTEPMIGPQTTKPDDPFSDLPDRLKATLGTIAGLFNSIPEDEWGNALLDIAEVLQKGRRY